MHPYCEWDHFRCVRLKLECKPQTLGVIGRPVKVSSSNHHREELEARNVVVIVVVIVVVAVVVVVVLVGAECC